MPVEHCSREKIIDVREQRRVAAPLELRTDSGSDQLVLEGYAATFEPYDCYGGVERGGWVEQIAPTAFDKTLRGNPDVQLLVNHGELPLARTTSGTLKLSADRNGLKVRALLEPTDPDVQKITPKMNRGDLNEMSFAFRVLDQVWSNDYTHRLITEVSLQRGDVSVVSYGMNPDTKATLSRETISALARMSDDELVELRNMDAGEIQMAIAALAKASGAVYSIPTVGVTDDRAAGDPSAPSGNPHPNMQDSMMVPTTDKDTDPSDPSGSEIQSGIHHEPVVTKTGDAAAPVKKVIDPMAPQLVPSLVAALQSTISHAHSVAASNNDSARALIAEAVEQIERIAAEYANTPKPESTVEKALRTLRGGLDQRLAEVRGVAPSPVGSNPFPHLPGSEFDAEANGADIIPIPSYNGDGYDDNVGDKTAASNVVNDDSDDAAQGMTPPGDPDPEDYLIEAVEDLVEAVESEERIQISSVNDALKEIRNRKGIPEINSVADGLAYIESTKRN